MMYLAASLDSKCWPLRVWIFPIGLMKIPLAAHRDSGALTTLYVMGKKMRPLLWDGAENLRDQPKLALCTPPHNRGRWIGTV